jgi:enoyl-CoA hydratase
MEVGKMHLETLLLDVADRIATVTVNRPETLNALNAVAKRELAEVFRALRTDPGVDVVILTGAGEKAFVAGTDIRELQALDHEGGTKFAAGGQDVFDRIEGLGKPVIAAVNGFALGGGCELALACHLRIAADSARFGQPEVSLGVIPGYGGTQRLPRAVGRARAMEMILTGAMIDAQEALRIGLVNAVVPRGELPGAARAMAATIASKAQPAVRLALKAVSLSADTTQADGMQREAELFGDACDTNDFREGVAAFLEKRKPVFRGS